MTKEIDNKVKEYVDRAINLLINDDSYSKYKGAGYGRLRKLTDKGESRVSLLAELIQREEHYQKSNKVNHNRRDDLTPGQVQEVKDIIDSRHVTRPREELVQPGEEVKLLNEPVGKEYDMANDEDIDYSDIPELTQEFFDNAKVESPQSINTLKVGDKVKVIDREDCPLVEAVKGLTGEVVLHETDIYNGEELTKYTLYFKVPVADYEIPMNQIIYCSQLEYVELIES